MKVHDQTVSLSFEEFRDYIIDVVERLNADLEDSEATWPGVLFLEVPEQGLILAEARSLVGLEELDKQRLATVLLPERIRRSKADRFAWVMPAWKMDRQPPVECLVVVLAEPGRREARIADVFRGDWPPKLGPWSEATRDVQGLFVEPLCRALLAKRRPKLRPRRKGQSATGRKQIRGRPHQRVELGRPLIPHCPDCRAAIDEPHRLGCDIERCTVCFGQRLMCDCDGHDAIAAGWTGEWPGARQCRALGWWAVWTDRGWRPCAPDTPGAREDVNRLAFFLQTGYDCLYEELDDDEFTVTMSSDGGTIVTTERRDANDGSSASTSASAHSASERLTNTSTANVQSDATSA
jgi:hypothetical protein